MAELTPKPKYAEEPRGNDFVRLYLANERRIYSYILAVVPNWSDADDLLQEAAEVMWSKFSEFEIGTDFVRWALSVARFRVLNYYKTKKQRVKFSSPMLEVLESEAVSHVKEQDDIHHALRHCIKKLAQKDRQLLELRYEYNVTVKSVALRVGRGIDSVYKALNRIHNQLFRCIRNNLGLEIPV